MKLLLLLAAVAVGVYFLRKQLKKVKADSPKLPVEKAPELPLEEVKAEVAPKAVEKSDAIAEVVVAKKAPKKAKKEVVKKPAAKKAKVEAPKAKKSKK